MTCGGGYQWRNRTITQEALNGGTECQNCTDSSTTGNCGYLDLLATYDLPLVEDHCDRGDNTSLGATYCEETCDNILGQFCPNKNEYQDCNTNGCPGT